MEIYATRNLSTLVAVPMKVECCGDNKLNIGHFSRKANQHRHLAGGRWVASRGPVRGPGAALAESRRPDDGNRVRAMG